MSELKFNRRNFLALIAFAGLSACMNPQVVEPNIAQQLNVVDVTVETAVKRKNTALPKDQILEATRSRLSSTLTRVNPTGSQKVRAEVNVVQFYIANPAAGILIGSSASGIQAEVTLVDVETGEVVGETLEAAGGTPPRPTIFGAAAIKPPKEEVAIITNSLAERVKAKIYGE